QVLIEHEYGIFGGEAGAYVLSLVHDLRQPFVVTLHTVLSEPSARQAEVLGELCHRAALVTVFTETARRMVVESGIAPAARVRVVPHGAP
ncbi:glycosyltransferase, partial [Streptobacillus moniliformis]|uniref:glycosyltransferase n=1 Tax=Streptobacillus moniliformis TaxID=34105 RepID=UPI0034D4CE66